MEFEIPIDLMLEKEFLVKENHLTAHLGSSSISVLSTPSMILFMEIVSRICAEQVLPKEYNTVGTKLTIEHLAAAPLGAKIKAKTKIKEYKIEKYYFKWKHGGKAQKLVKAHMNDL